MEIQFSRGGLPDGGKISNFLLEKVIIWLSSSLVKWWLSNVDICVYMYVMFCPKVYRFHRHCHSLEWWDRTKEKDVSTYSTNSSPGLTLKWEVGWCCYSECFIPISLFPFRGSGHSECWLLLVPESEWDLHCGWNRRQERLARHTGT